MEALVMVIILALSAASFEAQATKIFSPFEEIHELLAFGEQLTVQEHELIVLLGSSGVEKGNLVRFVIQDDALKVKRRGTKLFFDVTRSANR
jgi:ABC-type proline/glycine betaine transport system ATPase subunit